MYTETDAVTDCFPELCRQSYNPGQALLQKTHKCYMWSDKTTSSSPHHNRYEERPWPLVAIFQRFQWHFSFSRQVLGIKWGHAIFYWQCRRYWFRCLLCWKVGLWFLAAILGSTRHHWRHNSLRAVSPISFITYLGRTSPKQEDSLPGRQLHCCSYCELCDLEVW